MSRLSERLPSGFFVPRAPGVQVHEAREPAELERREEPTKAP